MCRVDAHVPRLLFALVAVVTTALLAPATGLAAGVTTHAFMADKARAHLPAGSALRTLLTRHRGALLAGAAYPDGGYAASTLPGGTTARSRTGSASSTDTRPTCARGATARRSPTPMVRAPSSSRT